MAGEHRHAAVKERFHEAYRARSEEWLAWLARSHVILRDKCRYLLLVLGSVEYGAAIARCLDEVEARGSFISEPIGAPAPTQMMTGSYKGLQIGVLHQAITPQGFGASYTSLAFDALRGSQVEVVIAVGEMSSLQDNLRVGHYAVPAAAIRGDDIHLAFAPPDQPAVADLEVSASLQAEAAAAGLACRAGIAWSCGAAAGIYDPLLEDQALAYSRLGVLGNCLEAATAYLLGHSLGIRVGSLWLVADSMFEPLAWSRPVMRQPWSPGWESLVRIALRTFARLEAVKRR